MISRLLERVAHLPHPGIDRALAAALPTAGAEEVRNLAQVLIRRGSAEGREAVVEMFHRLPEDLRRHVLTHPEPYLHAIRRAAAKTRSAAGGNAVTLIRHARLGSMAYLVTGVLRHGDPTRRHAAAQALLDLALWCGDQARGKPGLGHEHERTAHGPAAKPGDKAYIESAVAEAVINYAQHREDDALRACLSLLPRRLPQVIQALSDEKHAAVATLRRMLGAASESASRRALLPMIAVATLTDAAAAGIAQTLRRGGFGEVLANHHLLRQPSVRRVISSWESPADWLPPMQAVAELDARAQIGLIDWLDALSLSAPDRIATLSSWLDVLTSPAARAMASRRLLQMHVTTDSGRGAALIERLACDADEAVARMAARSCLRASRGEVTPATIRLLKSPHRAVARLAEERLAGQGFDRLWNAWPKLSDERRLAAAGAFMKIDARFHEALRARLGSSEPSLVIRALQMVALLDQGPFFEPELTALVEEPDARVAASAVRALGSVGGRAAQTIGRMLGHRDARVRANAVEAWQRLDADDQQQHLAQLHAMAEREDNRPRANAILALIEHIRRARAGTPGTPETSAIPVTAGPKPDEALEQMLHDPRPEHRISALWVAQSTDAGGLAAAVGEMAVSDPDHAVRQRAQRVFEQMIQSLSTHGAHATTRTHSPAAIARIEGEQGRTRQHQQGAA